MWDLLTLMMWRGFCIINKVFGCRLVSFGSCTIISSIELNNLFRWTVCCLSIIPIKVTHLVQYKTVAIGEGETQLRIWIWPLYSAVTFLQNKSKCSSLRLNGFNAFLWPNQRRSYIYWYTKCILWGNSAVWYMSNSKLFYTSVQFDIMFGGQ